MRPSLGLLALGLVAAALSVGLPASAQEFGARVLIDGDRIMIAEPTVRRPATLYTYEGRDSEWQQTRTLQAPPHDGGDFFGRFFALDEQNLIVGGTLVDNSTGAVWIYSRNAEGFELQSILQPDGVAEEEAFGRFGALHGDLLFVSSLGYRGVGGVWVFERDGSGSFVEQAVLQPDDPAEREFFGWDLSFDGERLIVGSFGGQEVTGAAYIFARDADGWNQEARLALPEDQAEPGDVGIPGAPGAGTIGVGWFQGLALLGLPGRENGEGAVFTYTRNEVTGDWIRETTLSAFDRRPGAFFGHEFYEHEGQLWVAAPGADFAGAIYRFAYDSTTGRFGAASKISNTIEPEDGDGFGGAVATTGDLAVVGQPGDDGGYGSAVVMRNIEGEWVSQAKIIIPGEPGLPALVGSEVLCGAEGKADQFDCSRVDMLSFLPLDEIGGSRGTQLNDVWGWEDPETGREYAIVGRTDGTSFVDVSDPVSPVYVGNLPRTPGTRANAWRDIKVFGNHAYVVADGAGRHGVQIFDLTRLRDLAETPVDFDADAIYRGVANAHNIAINEETGTAFVLGSNSGGESCGGGLHILDLSEPLEPAFEGCFQDLGTGRSGSGYVHDAMCIIYDGPDLEHQGSEICFGANETAFSIADVSDPTNPVGLATASYPNVAYAHQGWITEDHRYFYLGDELDEGRVAGDDSVSWEGARTLIWDVTDLDDPILVKEHFGETFTTDHNMYIKGNLMYQSNYVGGLRILNIADPENPVEVGFFDTVPWNESAQMSGSWSNYPYFESGTIAVTSRGEGVFFVRYRPLELLP